MIFRSLKLIFLNFKCLPIIFIYIFFISRLLIFYKKIYLQLKVRVKLYIAIHSYLKKLCKKICNSIRNKIFDQFINSILNFQALRIYKIYLKKNYKNI